MPQWSTHVGNNTVLEDDVVFLHKQEELAVAHGLGKKPVAQVSMTSSKYVRFGRPGTSQYEPVMILPS